MPISLIPKAQLLLSSARKGKRVDHILFVVSLFVVVLLLVVVLWCCCCLLCCCCCVVVCRRVIPVAGYRARTAALLSPAFV